MSYRPGGCHRVFGDTKVLDNFNWESHKQQIAFLPPPPVFLVADFHRLPPEFVGIC